MHTNHPRNPFSAAASLVASAVLALTLLCPLSALAQGAATGTITGRVLNQGTGEYLRNATVTVVGTQITAVAEAGGNFTLLNVPAGPVKLAANFTGLDAQEASVVVAAGQTATQDFTLTSKDYGVVRLGEFVVASATEGNAKAIMEQKNSIESKRVLATDTFGSISEGNVGEFLKYLPGVVIDYTEADARSVSLGGLDSKYTAVTIDGNPIASSGLAAASGTGANRGFEFEQISINSIESVELSRTPQPENPGSAMAGIVNLRSKGAFDRTGRQIFFNLGLATNSMSGNPFKKQPGWDDEKHYRVQPNFGLEYSDVFFQKRLGVRFGYNYSYTFSEQKAETVTYAYDTDRTNNAIEVPRLTSIAFRDSPKPTIRYNTNLRVDFKFSPDLWFSARAEYNRYHAKFFSRDLGFNFTTTANSPDPDGAGTGVAGPVVPNVEYSLNSQTATVGNVSVNQGGGGTNKYGATSNFGADGHFQRGAFRADFGFGLSRSQTWYKNREFGFFWSINPGALNNVGLRFNRDGTSDPGVQITQTSGLDYRNLANYPNGFSATTNDRQGEDQRYTYKADMQYAAKIAQRPVLFKFGGQSALWVNNADRPVAGFNATRLGADGLAASADEALALWAEPSYRMQFDYRTNIDGLANLDRWALYKDFQAHPEYWTAPTAGQLLQFQLQNSRDIKERIDALYSQTIFKFGKLTIAPGVRFERTNGTAFGPTDRGDRETRRIMGLPYLGTLVALPASVTTDIPYVSTRYGSGRAAASPNYNTWLRYLHTTYRFNPSLVLKASYNQAISRPDMNRLIGGLVVTNDNPDDPVPNRANAGNENLKPELSETINLNLEYYLKGVGTVSVSAYRRDISQLLRTIVYTVPAGGTWNGDPLPTSVSPLEAWEISTVDNIGKAHMSSIEFAYNNTLSFLPGPFGKIRFNANYTRIRYDDYDNFFRPTNTANVSWIFPYRTLALRINSNWVPGYRRELSTVNNGWALHIPETFTHTADFTWQFRRNTYFYLNARNITNQRGGEYRGRSDFRTRWVQTGSVISTGIRGTF